MSDIEGKTGARNYRALIQKFQNTEKKTYAHRIFMNYGPMQSAQENFVENGPKSIY